MKNIIVPPSILIVVCLFVSCGNRDTPNEQNTPPNQYYQPSSTIAISESQLFSEYASNEVRADANYKGKILSVTAKVTDITTLNGESVIICQLGQYEIVGCFSNKEDLISINTGSTITFKGVCQGISNFAIVFKPCSI